MDAGGRIMSWPSTAVALFGVPAEQVTGRGIEKVLLTGPGQADLVRRVLAHVGDGQVWESTVAGGRLGQGRVTLRFEPGSASGSEVMVAARRVPDHGAWLAKASDQLGGSLDLGRTAAEIAGAVVPTFADMASVLVAERLLVGAQLTTDPAGAGVPMRRLAGRMAGQDQAATDAILTPGEAVYLDAGTAAAIAVGTAAPVLASEMDAKTARSLLSRRGGDTVARLSSFLIVPLTSPAGVTGVIVLGRVAASPPFNQGDISHATELAARAAIYVENARLYEQERRTALALKRGLQSAQPDIPPGLQVAHRYLPVGGAVIGGDWHDIVAMPGGSTALMVGDVMGHGPEAAAVMAQLRAAAHALASIGLPPAQVLASLDRMAARMSAAQFATCAYAVTDPRAQTCTVALAGHLPPVLIHPDGDTELLDLPAGLPVGLGAGATTASVVAFPPGATLAMCTDGLVEGRDRALGEGLTAFQEALAEALPNPREPLATAADRIIARLCTRVEDDVTLLLARACAREQS